MAGTDDDLAERMFAEAESMTAPQFKTVEAGGIRAPATLTPSTDDASAMELADSMFAQANARPDKSGLDPDQVMYDAVDSGAFEIPAWATFVTSAADVASFGSLNKMNAAISTVVDAVKGDLGEGGISEAYAENYDEAILGQKLIRYAHPGWALGGDVAGGVTSGVALAKGGIALGTRYAPTALQWVGQASAVTRAAIAGTFAGTEAAAYRINKDDGNLVRAGLDAGVGFIGGSAVSLLLQGSGKLLSQLTGFNSPDAIKNSIGETVMATINKAQKATGAPELSPSQVAKQIEAIGPDASVLDLFPGLRETAVDLFKKGTGSSDMNALLGLIAERGHIAEDLLDERSFMKGLNEWPGVRSPTQMNELVEKRFKRLQPEFTKVFAANQGALFSAKSMIADITKIFGKDNSRLTKSAYEFINDLTADIKAAQKRAGVRTAKGTTIPKNLTLEQVVDMSRRLSAKITDNAMKILSAADQTLGVTKTANRDMQIVDDYLTEKINILVPDMIIPNNVYGKAASSKTAYHAGVDYMSTGAKDTDVVGSYLSRRTKSAAERIAFVEGMKFNLYTRILEKAKEGGVALGFDTVLSTPLIKSKIQALMGDKAGDDFITSLQRTVQAGVTVDMLRKAALKGGPMPVMEKQGAVQALADFAIINSQSRGASLGAGRRIAMQATNRGLINSQKGAEQITDQMLGSRGPKAEEAFNGLQQLMDSVLSPGQSSNALASTAIAAATGKAVGNQQ